MYNVIYFKSKGFALSKTKMNSTISAGNYTKSRVYISGTVLCGVGIFIKGLRRSKQKVSIVKAALEKFLRQGPRSTGLVTSLSST